MTTTLLLIAASCALGQAAPVDEAPAVTAEPWRTSVDLSANHILAFDTDIDNSAASLTTNTTRFGAGVNFTRPDNRLAFGVGFRGAVAVYDFENGDTILAGLDDDPFDAFTRQRLELSGRYAFNETWGIFGLVGVEAAHESGADIGSAIQGGGTVIGTWTNSTRDLTLGFGLGGFTRLDESPVVFPLVTVRWQIDQQLRLENERLGLALTYEPNDDWAFGLFGRFDRVEYRLDENNSASSEGVLKDNRIAIGGRVTWTPECVDGLSLSLTGGVLVYREIELLDDDGDDLFAEDADPSAFIGVSVAYEF